jgi:osmotically-inducible protein OsmY
MIGIVSRANLLQALLSREPASDGSQLTDAQLRRDVSDAIEKQPWASAWPTNVLVSAGIVHLWGFVPNDVVRKAYRVTAENIRGVKAVKNHMRTVPAAISIECGRLS